MSILGRKSVIRRRETQKIVGIDKEKTTRSEELNKKILTRNRKTVGTRKNNGIR